MSNSKSDKSKKPPKFTRQHADERRDALIKATVHCLATIGPRSTSVRAICAEAGVSPGLLRHYFDGKEDLVASAYEYLTKQLEDKFDTLIQSDLKPTEKLKQGFSIVLEGEWVSQEMLGAWVGFWSLQRNDARLQKHHLESNNKIRDIFTSLLQEYAKVEKLSINETELKFAAIELAGLGDGLWLELCLDSVTFTGADAVKICMNWLDGFNLRYNKAT